MAQEIKKDEDWMQQKWRPAMGWMYMIVCMFDMIIFPILWSILQAVGNQGHVETQWNPLTLQGAGLFHIAMGAVLGIAAFGRTQEKIAGTANNVVPPVVPASIPTSPSIPAPVPMAPRPVPMAAPPVPSMDLLPDDPPTRNTRND